MLIDSWGCKKKPSLSGVLIHILHIVLKISMDVMEDDSSLSLWPKLDYSRTNYCSGITEKRTTCFHSWDKSLVPQVFYYSEKKSDKTASTCLCLLPHIAKIYQNVKWLVLKRTLFKTSKEGSGLGLLVFLDGWAFRGTHPSVTVKCWLNS